MGIIPQALLSIMSRFLNFNAKCMSEKKVVLIAVTIELGLQRIIQKDEETVRILWRQTDSKKQWYESSTLLH
jgi:hypothetical protein